MMPVPPIPPEVDVGLLPYTPIYRHRLFASRTHAVASADEWRAAFLLWLKAWDQKSPSGSLPNDDRELAHLAELELSQWRRVKKTALHGWEKYDDGRLYHPVVTETILDAWAKIVTNRKRTDAARKARSGTVTDNVTGSVTGDEGKGIEGKGVPPLTPPKQGGNARGRARRAISKNGSGEALPALEPKKIGHSLPCSCPNCTRWIKQQRNVGNA